MYSSPPAYGARIVDTILGDTDLKQRWFVEVKAMADRIIDMRARLRRKLEELNPQSSWAHMTDQIGMYASPSPLGVILLMQQQLQLQMMDILGVLKQYNCT